MPVSGALLLLLLFAPPEDYFADALKALDAHQPAVAEPLLRKAIGADLNPGILLLRDKMPADALPVLKEAAETRPNEPRPDLYYAQALLESGDAAEAEVRYTSLVASDPKSTAAQLGLARALLKCGKLAEAAEHFRAAGLKNGLLDVASEYEKSGNKSEAMTIYREFPENAAVRERLGPLLVDDRNAAAIPNPEAAVKTAPTTANRLALADACKLAGDLPKMLEQLQLAATADPGRTLRDQHKLLPAARQFSAATRITPDKLKQKPRALAAYTQFQAADNNAHPDQEFQARQRMRIIENEFENELKKK